MNLSTKTAILLVFINRLKCLIADDKRYDCVNKDDPGIIRIKLTGKCIERKFYILEDLKRNSTDKNKKCCFRYYITCASVITTQQMCKPGKIYIGIIYGLIKGFFRYEEQQCTDFRLSKSLCSEYERKVDPDKIDSDKCAQFTYDECHNYKWNPHSVTVEVPQTPKPTLKPVNKETTSYPQKSNKTSKDTSNPKGYESLAPISVNVRDVLILSQCFLILFWISFRFL